MKTSQESVSQVEPSVTFISISHGWTCCHSLCSPFLRSYHLLHSRPLSSSPVTLISFFLSLFLFSLPLPFSHLLFSPGLSSHLFSTPLLTVHKIIIDNTAYTTLPSTLPTSENCVYPSQSNSFCWVNTTWTNQNCRTCHTRTGSNNEVTLWSLARMTFCGIAFMFIIWYQYIRETVNVFENWGRAAPKKV